MTNAPDEKNSGLLSGMLGGSAFIFGCRVAGAALTLFAQVLLARWMGATQLGIFVLAFSWAILLANFASLGFPAAAIRFVSMSRSRSDFDYLSAFVHFSTRTVLLTGIVMSIGGVITVWLLHDAESPNRTPLTIAMLIIPLLSLLHLLGGIANGYSRFGLSFIPTNVARPAMFCCALGLAWLAGVDLHASAAIALQLLAVILVFIPTALVSRKLTHSPQPISQPYRDGDGWLRTASVLLIGTLFASYFPEIVIIVTGSFVSSGDLALLHISFRIAMLVAFVLSAVDAFTGPEIARLSADSDTGGLQRIVNRATRLRFSASVAAVVIFALVGRWILSLFGPEFVAGYPLLMILAFGLLIQGLVGPVLRLMSVCGHQNLTLPVFASALVLLVILIAVLVPILGVTGAAVAAAIDMVVWTIWMRWLVVRHIGVRPSIL